MKRIIDLAWLPLNAVQLLITLLGSMIGISLALIVRVMTGSERVPLQMASWFWAPALVHGALARVEVRGRENIDFDQAHVFVANHQSMIDICALFLALPVPLRFLLKSELGRMPFLGWYVRAMGMVLVQRGHARLARDQVQQATALVKQGHSLCAFPEGTRSLDGVVGEFKSGVFRVAIDAGRPVVPIAIRGSGQVMPPGGFSIRPGRIELMIGEPI
ncbi:MAG: lysophospholipid acyltransferase family protein, partial [Wenzhouxiangella sp.]